MYAQIFFKDDEFELYVGVAKVINVQHNGMVQLLITKPVENITVATGLSENRSETKKRIIVKPAMVISELSAEIVDEKFV